jgi:endo-1,4-beta-xylanase
MLQMFGAGVMRLSIPSSVVMVLMLLAGCSGSGGGSGQNSRFMPPPQTGINVPNLYVLAPMNMPVGVAVPAGAAANSVLSSMARQTIVNSHFSQITAENIMKPSYVHPAANVFFFDDADALVDYAVAQGKTVHGHVLVWHQQLPAWMQTFNGTPTEWSAMMDGHIDALVRHFANRNPGVVVSWDVVNEAFADSDGDGDGLYDLRDTIWLRGIGPGYLGEAFRTARGAAFNVDLYYNDYNLSGVPAKLEAVLALVDEFRNDPNPVPIDGVGFQMHVSLTWPDIADIRTAFATAAATGLKIKISELDITVNTDGSGNPGSLTTLTDTVATQQQLRFEAIVAAYLAAVPAAQRGGISVWGIADIDSWRRGSNNREWPLLFDDQFRPKPALQGFADGLAGGT